MTTISRRRSYTGQNVRVEVRDGRVIEGTLAGWGATLIRVRNADGTHEAVAAMCAVYAA